MSIIYKHIYNLKNLVGFWKKRKTAFSRDKTKWCLCSEVIMDSFFRLEIYLLAKPNVSFFLLLQNQYM